ncbi:MAG: hypothetical protein ACLFNM_03760 [Candidatus Woesearchaeota archaeon]
MSDPNLFSQWFIFAKNHLTLREIFSKKLFFQLFFLIVVTILGLGLFIISLVLLNPLSQYTTFLSQDVQSTLQSGTQLSSQQHQVLESLQGDIFQTGGLLFLALFLAVAIFATTYLVKFFSSFHIGFFKKKNSTFFVALLLTTGSLITAFMLLLLLWFSSLPLVLLVLISLLVILFFKILTFFYLGELFQNNDNTDEPTIYNNNNNNSQNMIVKNCYAGNKKKGIYFFIITILFSIVSFILFSLIALLIFTFIHPIAGLIFGVVGFFFWYVKKELLLYFITLRFFMGDAP